jgi:Tfp pilus assembly protein PilF
MVSAGERAKQQGQQQLKTNVLAACDKAAQLLAARRNSQAEQVLLEAIKGSGLGEAEVHKLGFEQMDQRGQPQVAELIMLINANSYPNSDKARDNYGVVLLESYKAAEAVTQFKKAIALAQANGRPASVLEGYQRHLERAEQLKNKK